MWRATTLSAIALMSGTVSLASAQQWGATSSPDRAPMSATRGAVPNTPSGERTRPDAAAEPVITEGQIVRLKTTLKLTPEQQPHWVPVEAALNAMARYQASDRTSFATTAGQLQRLKAIAAPLISSLDESQKRDAIAFARRIGYGQLVASF